ncbi:MAG: ABC transporter permease [Thermoanaerobacteraceae bacterium]|uniref:ABC transporter permease n=1 Tax=Herbinix luporum TaxID=1679721 RepID=UPI00177698FD|nr:ABC transporter permease [Herbinix luporum]NLZ52221.1 ABC transporter permease [Thermoanaerobacteraceae bacterium]HHT55972.1 ABC transporter permease [Herbinix luporum]
MENRKKLSIGELIVELSLPILLIALMVFFSLMTDKFFTTQNLTNILVQNVHVAICSAAVMIIMISGGTDLSIGYQMSVSAVLVAKMIGVYKVPVAIAVICGIVLCSVLGTFNGFMALKLKSSPMIVTLGTMAIFQGISYLISESKTYHNLPRSFMYIGQGRIFGWLPINVLIMIVILLIVGFVMHKTVIGRKVYATGDNPEAARLAGLNVAKIKVLSFTVAGILVGISAVLLAARSGSADSATGVGIEFTGITACVLSGVALKGGEGTLWKVIVAVFVLGVLANGMQLINLGTYPQYIAKGIIMLSSLWLTNKNSKAM